MKNLKSFALAAISLLGFAACQQVEISPEVKPEATHTVTFVAGAPETKTTVDISGGENAIFAWTADDEKRIDIYEDGIAASTVVCGLDAGKMTIMASFAGTATGDETYVAVVNTSNDEQVMTAEAYDEDADILVSKAVTGFDGENGAMLQFKREVAIAKMTLKGLDAGEVVNMVTVSSTADIAGSYGVEGWASPAKTSLEISSASYMTGEGYSIVANEAGEAVVWFTCIPQTEATLTVQVEAADGDIYTKEFSKPITLTSGDVKAFRVAMTKKPWVPVELANIDETMPLVITMTTGAKTYALSLTGTDGNALGTTKAPKAIEVQVADGKLSEKPGSDILWNIENNNGDLTIYPNGVTNKWLYTFSDNNGVRLGTNTENGYVWSIDPESGYLKANAKVSEVRYLGVYQGKDWRAYTSTTGNIASQTLRFYSNASPNPTTPKLSVTPTLKTWGSTEKDAAVFTVTTNTAGVNGWTISPETLTWATIAVNKTAGTITVTPNDVNTSKTARKATITVTHASGTLTEAITLTQKAAGEETVEKTSELKASTTATNMNSYISYVNSANNSYSDPMRIYSGNTFTISANNAVITKVEFTCVTDYIAGLKNGTVTVNNGATSSMSANNNVVTYTITGSTTSFAVKASEQFRVSGLKVTYKTN